MPLRLGLCTQPPGQIPKAVINAPAKPVHSLSGTRVNIALRAIRFPQFGVSFVIEISAFYAIAVVLIPCVAVFFCGSVFTGIGKQSFFNEHLTMRIKCALLAPFSVFRKSKIIKAFKIIGRKNALAIRALYLPRTAEYIYHPCTGAVCAICTFNINSAISTKVIFGISPLSYLTTARERIIRNVIIKKFIRLQILIRNTDCCLRFFLCPFVFFYIFYSIFSFFVSIYVRALFSIVIYYGDVDIIRNRLVPEDRIRRHSHSSFRQSIYNAAFHRNYAVGRICISNILAYRYSVLAFH